MTVLPAFCNTCGAIFSSGFTFNNCKDITLQNCTTGPCPACGGKGHVPDGVYNFIGNTIELLSGPGKTVNELNKLAAILRHSKEKGLSTDEIKQQVQREVPELTSIADLLPKTRQDVYQFIVIILTVINMLVSNVSAGNQPNVTINKVIENTYYLDQTPSSVPNNNMLNKAKTNTPQKPIAKPKKARIHVTKTGRNKLCPCGSELKHKKCCGKVSQGS